MTPDKLTHTHPYQDAVRRMKRAILQSIACESKPQCAAHDDIVQIVLVGPRSSASFQKLLTTDTDPDLVVLSPTATASFDALDKLQRWSSGSGLVPSERVLSVIANDPVLTTSIVNELARRGILSHVRCEDKQLIAGRSSSVGLMTQHRILMLGESDHPYARLLRWEYAAAFERHLSPKAQALVTEIPDHKVQQLVGNVIYHYDYFRQLDTEETAPPQPQAATSNPGLGGLSATMSSLSSAQIERPEGRSQIDYIRRIIDSAKRRLADEPHGTQIVAVGVIATDPYDKLLILQAVRKAFPNAVFFVHDVDARLLHPRELPFTRNTIIAASYGLDPDEILPGRRRRVGISAPTMRDSHQSATYVATHHAVTQCNECLLKTFPPFHEKPLGAIAAALPRDRDTETEKIQSSAESSHPTWPHARIYEIGRRGIVRLDPVNPGSGISEPVLMVCLVLAALTVGLGGELHRLWPIRPRASVSVKEGGVWRWLSRKYLYYSVLALAGFMLVLRLDDAGFASIEPLSLTNGVSVWPFIGLHVLAAAAAVRVMLIVILRTKMLSQDIEKIDGCTPPARAMTWFQESKRFVASLWLKDVHGWTHPLTKLGSPVDFWERVRNSLTVRVIFGVSLFKLGAFLAFMFAILYAYGPDPDSFRWARDSVRRYAEITWLVAYGAFVLAVLVFREVANVVIKAVSHLRWNRVICPGWSITALHAPSGPPEVSAVLTRARMIEDLATEVARLAVLLLFVLLPMIVSQSKIFERMVFSPMVMILLLIPSLLWLMPLAILQTRVRSSRGELVEELLEIKRGFLQANPPLGASDPSVASVDAAIRTVEAGGGPMAKPLMLGPFAKLLIPVVGGLALLAMHVLWGPY